MPEKEHIEGMLRMLQKLQEAASGGGGQFAQRHAEQAQKYISEVSSRWAKKATNKENPSQQQEARTEAKLEADTDNYKATNQQNLREARRNMRNTVRIVEAAGRQVPDYLQPYVATPQTATVARLIERVTIASDDLRNNPSFLIREAAKSYWGTNWMELTFDQAHETHEVLDKVIHKARDLAVQPTTDPEVRKMHDQIFSVRDAEYWQVFDYRTDVYRTEKITDKNVAGNPLRGREKTRRDSLVDVLQREQKYLDNLHEYGLDPVKEKKTLENIQELIARGKANKNPTYREEDTRPYLEKIQRRLNEINRELEFRRVATRGQETTSSAVFEDEDFGVYAPRIQEAIRTRVKPLTKEQKTEMFDKIQSPELKSLADEILRKIDKEVSMEDLESLRVRLAEVRSTTQIRDLLHGAGRLTGKEMEEALFKEGQATRLLEQILTAKAFELQSFTREAPARSYWYDKNKIHFIDRMINFDFKESQGLDLSNDRVRRDWLRDHGEAYDKIDFDALDEVFFDIVSFADYRPAAPFAEAFNFFRQTDVEGFYGLLESRLHTLSKENPNLITPHDIQLIVERYTRLYELKEIYHNLIYLQEGASADGRDMAAKYLGTWKDEYANFMFKNVRGIERALSLQESVIEQIAADNDRRLPPDLMARVEGGKSMWTETYYKLYSELIERATLKDASGQYKFPELKELRGMSEWEKKIAIEMAYGFSIADMQLPMKLTRVVGGRGYTSVWGESLKFDVIRGIFLKFKVPKPGVAALYMILTGDKEGAKTIASSTDVNYIDKFIDMYEKAPNTKSIAGMRNFLDISSRFGSSSGWGANFASHEFSRELKEHQGFALDIRDATDKVMFEEKAKLDERFRAMFGDDESHKVADKTKEEWKRMEIQKLEQSGKIKRMAEEKVKKSLERALNVTPLAVVRRWVDDPVMHKIPENGKEVNDPAKFIEKRWDLIEEIIRSSPGGDREINRILTGDPRTGEFRVRSVDFPGGGFDVDPVTQRNVPRFGELIVRRLKDLWVANPRNRDINFPEQHLIGTEQLQVKKAWGRFMEKVRELEGDLELAQQTALSRIKQEIKTGNPTHDRLLNEDYEVIEGTDRVNRIRRAQLYARRIRALSIAKQTDGAGRVVGHSFVDRVAERVITRQERYLISTVDVPWAEFSYVRMGGRGMVRAWIDANAQMEGGKGFMPYLNRLTANPKWEELLGIMKEKIYDNIAMYWDNVAQEVTWTLLNNSLNIYGEKGAVTILGPFGDLWEKWDFISDTLEKYGLYRAQASLSKVIIAHDAISMGPNEKRRVIRMADGMNLLAKNPIPLGQWVRGLGAQDFTARALEERQHARVSDVWKEIIAYTPMVIPIMIFEGFREAGEEEKKR